jgi:hypothetical protein
MPSIFPPKIQGLLAICFGDTFFEFGQNHRFKYFLFLNNRNFSYRLGMVFLICIICIVGGKLQPNLPGNGCWPQALYMNKRFEVRPHSWVEMPAATAVTTRRGVIPAHAGISFSAEQNSKSTRK